MPAKGQILINPHTGDRFEFIETSDENSGEKVVIKMTLKSKGQLVPNHLHVLQDEHYEVLSGKLTYLLDNKICTLTAGEKILLPKLKAHNHYNMDDVPLVMIQTITPGLDIDFLIENLIGLTIDGKIKNGKAGLVQELVTLKYLDSKAYLADIPIAIQNLLMNLIAPVARLFGYRAIYKKYSGVEK